MNANTITKRPRTLVEGQSYLLIERNGGCDEVSPLQVTFLAYTACPEVVVIMDDQGVRQRCAREHLVAFEEKSI